MKIRSLSEYFFVNLAVLQLFHMKIDYRAAILDIVRRKQAPYPTPSQCNLVYDRVFGAYLQRLLFLLFHVYMNLPLPRASLM